MSFASYRAAVGVYTTARFSGRPCTAPDPLAHGAVLGAWSVWECGEEGPDVLVGLFASESAADAVCCEFNGVLHGVEYRVSREYVWPV